MYYSTVVVYPFIVTGKSNASPMLPSTHRTRESVGNRLIAFCEYQHPLAPIKY
jgi:hypothetical protein